MRKNFDIKLFKEAGLLSISNIINSLSNGLIIIAINKYLQNDQGGHFLYLLSIASPLFIFFSFDLRRKVTVGQLDEYSLNEAIAIRNVLAACGLLLFIVIGLLHLNFSSIFISALLLIGLGKIADSITEINFAIFQINHGELKILISRLIKVLCCSLIFIIVKEANFLIIFSVFTISNVIPFLFYEIPSLKSYPSIKPFNYNISNTKIIKFTQKNINLAVASLIMTLAPNIPIYFIKFSLDIDSVTQFSSLNFVISSLYITGSGLSYALLKKFKVNDSEGDRSKLNAIFRASIASISFYTVFGSILYLVDGLTLAFNSSYSNLYYVFSLLLVSGFLFTVCSYLNNFILYKNKNKLLLALRVIRLVIIVITCAIAPFISKTLEAYAFCIFISNLLDLTLHIFIAWKLSTPLNKMNSEGIIAGNGR